MSSYLYDGYTRYSVNTTKLNEIGLEFTSTDSYGVQYTYIWSSEIVYETQVSAAKVAASRASYTTNHKRTTPLFHAMCKF